MTTTHAKEPSLNSTLFNKGEYCYHDKLNSFKDFENQISDILRKDRFKNTKIMKSKLRNVDILKKKLIKLFEINSYGIHLEKLHNSFLMHFGCSLIPQDYGFSDIVNLLTHFKDILTLKKGPNNSIVVVRVDTNDGAKNENTITDDDASPIENEEKIIPDEVLNVFIMILSSYGGGIPLDNLLPEYEFRCGKKLSLEELNMKSIFELASYLGPRFRLCDVNKSQSVLYDSEQLHDCPCKNSLYSNNITFIDEETKMDVGLQGKELAKELFIRLVDILVTEFPQGLYLEELLCAYKGFYDAYAKEFEPFNSPEDLKNLLESEKGFFNFIRQHGKIFVTAGAFYQERLRDATMSLNIVSFSSSYRSVDLSLFKEGSFVDINVADVYNPKKFWVIKRGKNNSEALDEMMDRMLEFYGGEIGKRFLIPKENTPNIPGSPVVALYPQDMNFYRAIVISREDVQNIKIFYIDYGTNDSVSLYSLYYLHKRFFDFPAQAIKCSLHGLQPLNKKTSWPKSDTLQFLNMARDKSFVAYINKNEGNKSLQVTLYDTAGEKEVNINQYLVDHGFAASVEAEEASKPHSENELIIKEEVFDNFKICNSPAKSIIPNEFNDSDEVGNPLMLQSNSWIDSSCSSSVFKVSNNSFTSSPCSKLNKPLESSFCSSTPKTHTDNFHNSIQPKDKKVCPHSINTKGFSFRSFANSLNPLFNSEDISSSEFSSTFNNTSVKSKQKFNTDSGVSLIKGCSNVSNLNNSLMQSDDGSPSKNITINEDPKSTSNFEIMQPLANGHPFSFLNGLSFNSSSSGSENHHSVANFSSNLEDGSGKPVKTSTLKKNINYTSPKERDLTVHSSKEEKETGESLNFSQFAVGNSPSSFPSRSKSNQVTEANEHKADFQDNNGKSVRPTSLCNSVLDDNDQEVFYSDDDASSSSFSYESEWEPLTPLHLPNGQIIHIIFTKSMHYVPFPELPLLLDLPSLSKLETSLCQEDKKNAFTLCISRRRDFYIYMLLAREGVSYVFSPKEFVPKTINLLSLAYLIHFTNLEMENSSKEFINFVKIHLDTICQSQKQVSPIDGLSTSVEAPKNSMSSIDNYSSLKFNSKKSSKLNKAASLPSNLDICNVYNEESHDIPSAINVVVNGKTPNVDSISPSTICNKDNVSKDSVTSSSHVIVKHLTKKKEEDDKLFIINVNDKLLISQNICKTDAYNEDCCKGETYDDHFQKGDFVNNLQTSDSFVKNSNLNCVQKLNSPKISEKNETEDKSGSSHESGIVIPVNSSLHYPNHLQLMSHSLDSSFTPSNVANKAFFNNTLPLQEPEHSNYANGHLQNFGNLDNSMLIAAKNGKPPPGYPVLPSPPIPPHPPTSPPFVSSVPVDFITARPHFYKNHNYLWPPLPHYPSQFYGPNDYYQQFYRNFIFPSEFNSPPFRPI